jgi:uncharacterized membrane protein
MKQLAESIHPGDAALFVLIREMTADKVLASRRSRRRCGLRCSPACDWRLVLTKPESRDIKAVALPP